MNKISLAIAEDNPLALKSILKKLVSFGNLSILIEARNGAMLLDSFKDNQAEVVLMDIEMPMVDGLQATKQLKELYPAVKVIMLTTFDDDDKIFNAILAGASGYLLKDESAENIYKSILDVHSGGAAMSAGIALKTLNHIKINALNPVNLLNKAASSSTKDSILSQRETEILIELKNGHTYKYIADSLYISEGTVRKHIENIYRKLQVNNKVSAVNLATNNNWL